MSPTKILTCRGNGFVEFKLSFDCPIVARLSVDAYLCKSSRDFCGMKALFNTYFGLGFFSSMCFLQIIIATFVFIKVVELTSAAR